MPMHPMQWGGAGGGLMMILWWLVIIAGVVALVVWIAKQTSQRGEKTSPIDILKERYARGEISRKEFDEKRHDIA